MAGSVPKHLEVRGHVEAAFAWSCTDRDRITVTSASGWPKDRWAAVSGPAGA